MITDRQWRELLETRAACPEAVAEAYAARKRPERLISERGMFFLVAADHPARGALRSGHDPLAMAHRHGLLDRLVTAPNRPGVDGVLESPDVVEELLLLGALDGKVVIGSTNRGGPDRAIWTMDDRFTGYDAESIAPCRLGGGKMLLRIDDDDPAVARTIQSCARAVSALAARGLMPMVEPLPYGVPQADHAAQVASWGRTLRLPNVRGLVVGRTVLYPPNGDVAGVIDAAAVLHDATVGAA